MAKTLDITGARLTTLAVHKVGNKVRREGVVKSDSLYELDEDNSLILRDFFLTPFRNEEFFKLSHETDISLNEVYTYVRKIFDGSREDYLEQSCHLLDHLYAQSVHPHIKSGEFYVAHFREIELEGNPVEAVGLFKSEHKDLFLHFNDDPESVEMQIEQGVHTKKLDKGCLIFNTYPDDGYSVLMVDRESEDTQYWRDDFLHVTRILDNSYQTSGYLNLTRDFCEEVLAEEKDKKDQMLFLNRSLNYFTRNEDFNVNDFKDHVLEDPGQRERFDTYRSSFENELGLSGEDGFPISKYAVRNLKKHFKSLIKLDSGVELRLDNRRLEEVSDYVERGFDESRGMNYYKVYFNGEE